MYNTHTQPFYGSVDFVQDSPGELVTRNIHSLTPIVVIKYPYLLPPSTLIHGILPIQSTHFTVFLADRTIGRAYGTVCRLSVCRLSSSVCNVLYCGKTVRPSEKVSEGVNRNPGSKS